MSNEVQNELRFSINTVANHSFVFKHKNLSDQNLLRLYQSATPGDGKKRAVIFLRSSAGIGAE